MYLPPSQSEEQRQEIHRAFAGYCQKALEPLLGKSMIKSPSYYNKSLCQSQSLDWIGRNDT